MKMTFRPELSWGDLMVTTGLLVTGVLAFTNVSQGVALNTVSIDHIEAIYDNLQADYRQHLDQERQDRQLMRDEVRQDLRDIGVKLDSLLQAKPQ